LKRYREGGRKGGGKGGDGGSPRSTGGVEMMGVQVEVVVADGSSSRAASPKRVRGEDYLYI
jgi:hypothetical protein